MSDLGTIECRFYRDGPDWPISAAQQTAERAYRRAFLTAAREAARWPRPDDAAIRAAWIPRGGAKELAGTDGGWVTFAPGHADDASRTRGRVHGFEFVRQCFEELEAAGVAPECIRPLVIAHGSSTSPAVPSGRSSRTSSTCLRTPTNA